jgi:aspartate-semialdehyde dehydrogenase
MHVAIVGATGAVGQELAAILEERRFPAARISFFASSRSAGQVVRFAGREHTVRELSDAALAEVDLALFSAGSKVSKACEHLARRGGLTIVDNSSAFRMNRDVPLVVPEINPQDADGHRGIIANPNCSTIIMALAVWPLHQEIPVQRVAVSTYQAVSGAGAAAMSELQEQTRAVLAGEKPVPRVLPHPCAFNLFSHNSALDETGYNEEERKMQNETRKIFHAPELPVTATCVRVPVLRAHSEAINLRFARPMPAERARALLSGAPGVRVVDDRQRNHFPMPIEASGGDDILVGRIRQDCSDPTGCSLEMFACGDQLRKGAALNAIQIAELLVNTNAAAPSR